MDSLASWIVLAGSGALHGLSPAAGCLFVARRGRAGGWLPLLLPFALVQAGLALWPWATRMAHAAGWLRGSPLDDLCGPGSMGAAAWLPLAMGTVHAAGMLAGTAVAAMLAQRSPGASSILPPCPPSRSCRPTPSTRLPSMRLARPRSRTT